MKSAPSHPDEQNRLAALKALNILDSLPSADFDQIAHLASEVCGTPIAVISFVDRDRQWFKAKVGLGVTETPREFAFCAHAILQDDVMVVEDSSQDERFKDNPLVTGAPYVQFYAGAPLLSPDGYALGTVCVIDHKSRKLTSGQILSLKYLSHQVTRLLELRAQAYRLEDSENRLRTKERAIAAISDGVVLRDGSGKLIDVNSAALQILGLSREQYFDLMSNRSNWKGIKEDGSQLLEGQHPGDVALRTGKSVRGELIGIERFDGTTVWLQMNADPVFDESSQVLTNVVISFSDITLEVENRKRIESQKRELRFVLDSIPHMVGYWDANLVNLDSNTVYSAFFDRTPDQIRGRHIRELLGEELFEKNLPYLAKVLMGHTITFERPLPHRDGTTHCTLASYIPNLVDGKVASFLAIVMDVTDLKSMELERQKLELRLAEAARLSTLGEMAGGVAHEINNPLAIISGKVEVLRRKFEAGKLEREQGSRDFEIIEVTVDRIAKIVKGLRTYSRDAENDPYETIDVNSVVDDTLELCRERFKASNIDLRVQSGPAMPVECRAAQISQVLMNLLSNSYDAIEKHDKKWIEVRVQDDDAFVVIAVKDCGLGIEPDIVKKLMQPFFTTKHVGKGTGLGLSISVGIAQSHGGSLSYAENEANTTFVMRLPKVHSLPLKKSG